MSSEIITTLWVVYEHPEDFPNSYVVRRQYITRGSSVWVDRLPVAVGPDLKSVRSVLPPGLYNLGRQPEDMPQIKEVWI